MRVLLKVSGEFVERKKGILVDEIISIVPENEVAIVIGAGNIFRGRQKPMFLNRVLADHIGILSTIINGIYLKGFFESKSSVDFKVKIYSSKEIKGIVEEFDVERAINDLESGNVLIFVGGTGHPFFTTDTLAVLRALQIKADILLKATKVDGVYDKDPLRYKSAKMYKKISYYECIRRNIEVMDLTAFSLAKEFNLPIQVFKFQRKSLKKAIKLNVGTLVTNC